MVVDFTLKNIEVAAEALFNALGSKKVIAFHGEMGAGKTTLINELCRLLKTTDLVNSPTYSIINEYRTSNGKIIYHMDLYRLNSDLEAVNAGVEDALVSGNLCLVEWPEKAPSLFIDSTMHCYLSAVQVNGRKLKINL